jgi:hypothetical protein
MSNFIAMFKVFVVYPVMDRFWRTLRGCGIKHDYQMYAPHAYFGKAAVVEFKCSRCGDWYNEIQGWNLRD